MEAADRLEHTDWSGSAAVAFLAVMEEGAVRKLVQGLLAEHKAGKELALAQ